MSGMSGIEIPMRAASFIAYVRFAMHANSKKVEGCLPWPISLLQCPHTSDGSQKVKIGLL